MNPLNALLQHGVEALAPLLLAVDDVGVRQQLLDAIGAASGSTFGPLGLLADIRDAIEAVDRHMESPPRSLTQVRDALAAVRRIADTLRAMRASTSSGGVTTLGRDALDLLATRYVRFRWPLAYQLAVLTGCIEPRMTSSFVAEPGEWPPAVEHVVGDRIHQLLVEPVGALRSQLPADPLATRANADETADLVVSRAGGVLSALGLPWTYGIRPADAAWLGDSATFCKHVLLVTVPPARLGDARAGVMLALSPADEDDLGVVVTPFGGLNLQRTIGEWDVGLGLTAQVEGFAFGGGQGFQLQAGLGTAAVLATFVASRTATDEPLVLGSPSGTRLELFGTRLHAEASLSTARRTVALGCDVEQGQLVLTADGGDGFLASVLGRGERRARFDLGVAYATGRGLTLTGGVGFQLVVPVNVSAGPVSIDQVSVALEVSPAELRLVSAAGVRARIGPLLARIDGVGVEMVVALPGGTPARSLDLDLAFRAPRGVGLAIDAGAVQGGGFLQHDPATGRYSGVLAVEMPGLALSATGVLDTRVPGVDYSLAAVVSSRFNPIQLGLGFTLQGVGGLIGIHRQIDVDALRAALRGPGIGDT